MFNQSEIDALMRNVEAIPVQSQRSNGQGIAISDEVKEEVVAYSRKTGLSARVIGLHFGLSPTTTNLIIRASKTNRIVTKRKS